MEAMNGQLKFPSTGRKINQKRNVCMVLKAKDSHLICTPEFANRVLVPPRHILISI